MTDLIYSFVVDGAPKYQEQTRIFLLTLLQSGVSPDRIHAHLTPSAQQSDDLVRMMQEAAVHQHRLTPFLDGTYCNKLNQIDNLPCDPDIGIALCDTDLAFLDNLDAAASPHVIRAKPVDLPNPPLAYLEKARQVCGVSASPREVETSFGQGTTWSTNCNGGVYLIPGHLARALSAQWKRYASILYDNRSVLENFAHHVDQISFALAVISLGLDVDELPIDYNYPMHLAGHAAPEAISPPKVLHYHWLHNGGTGLQLTGHAGVDRRIEQLNALLHDARDRLLLPHAVPLQS